MHTLSLPFGFSVTTRLDTQSLGSSSFFITLAFSKRVAPLSAFFFSGREVHDGEA